MAEPDGKSSREPGASSVNSLNQVVDAEDDAELIGAIENPNETGTRLQPHMVVANRYEIISLIGSGGMGVVYKATDRRSLRFVAIKTISSLFMNEEAVGRFRKEAKAAGALNHPGVIKLYEFGMNGAGRPFLVMEFMAGGSLADTMKQHGQLPLERVLPMFIQVLTALAHAHAHGIIHRDLKPANLLLDSRLLALPSGEDPRVKIADFGVARMLEDDSGAGVQLTQTGELLGSPLYMSPEQCVGKKADHRSDIYSISCALYEALTGAPPFTGESPLAIISKHQQEKPQTLAEASMGRKFPRALEASVARALEKDPGKRYQSVQELIDDWTKVNSCLNEAADQEPKANLFNVKVAMPLPVVLGLIGGSMILSVCVTSLALMNKQEPKETKEITSEDTSSPDWLGPDASKAGDLLPSPANKTEIIGKFRILHFPSGESMGSVEQFIGSFRAGVLFPAVGRRQLPADMQLQLRPSWTVCYTPAYFDRLRPDDFVGMDFQNLPVNDDAWSHIARLTGLRELNLSRTDFNDKGAQTLLSLSDLQELNISKTDVTGKGFLILRKFKKLRTLFADYLQTDENVRQFLQSNPTLVQLSVRHDGLTDIDLEAIASVKTLRVLRLDYNPQISDSGIKYLTQLPQLDSLDVSRCGLTPGCFRYLQHIPQLRLLVVWKDSWSQADLARLKADAPWLVVKEKSED